ncbi:hypothetical protein PG984_014955 [Apiospora sp. TS-2023a]
MLQLRPLQDETGSGRQKGGVQPKLSITPNLTTTPVLAIAHPQRTLIVPIVVECNSTGAVKDHVNGLLNAPRYLGLPGIGAYIVENDIERIQDAWVSAKQAPVLGGHVVHAADVVDNAHQGVALRLVARRIVVRLPVAKERAQTLDEGLVLVNPSALLGPVALQGIVQGRDEHRLHHRGYGVGSRRGGAIVGRIEGRLGGP